MKTITISQEIPGNTRRRYAVGAAITSIVLLVLATGCKQPKITSPGAAHGKVAEPFTYQITATRNPTAFDANVPPPNGLSVNSGSGLISGTPQQAGDFAVTLKASNPSGQGTKELNLKIAPADGGTPTPTPPASHPVVSEKELFIIAPAVLTDARAQPGGAWHIRSALQRIAGAGVNVEAFAQAWFATWANNTSATGSSETFGARPWVQTALQQAWTANRIRLIAIVNRIDLTRFDNSPTPQPTSLGEGRFVYEVMDAANPPQPLPFTIIFEYKLPLEGTVAASLTQWAQRWHALGRPALGTATQFPPAYLAELQVITDKYSAHDNLNQIRANEFLTPPTGSPEWELREFHFVDSPARLQQVTVNLTPAIANNNQPPLASFIAANQANIIAGTAVPIPTPLQAAVSPVPTPSFTWTAPGTNPRATFITSFNTCSGCHAGDTGTLFQHIGRNAPQLSPFLKGSITLAEALPPTSNAVKTHNEMADRRRLLAAFAGDSTATPFTALPGQDLFGLIKARANRPH